MCSIREVIIKWYQDRGEQYSISGDSLQSRCIFHDGNNPSGMTINLISGRYKCWTHDCKTNPFKFFQTDAEEFSISEKKISNTNPSIEFVEANILQEGYVNLYETPTGKYAKYLLDRGFDESDIKKYEILCCDDKSSREYQRIVIPVRDKKRRLRTFCCRHIDPGENDRKYIYYEKPRLDLFYRSFDWNYSHPLVLCEGIFDTISLLKQGIPNATTPFSLNMSKYQLELLSKPSIFALIFAMDNPNFDKAGNDFINKKIQKIAYSNQNKYFGIMIPPDDCKDWNEAHLKGHDLNKIYQNSLKNLIIGKDLL